MQDQRTGAQPSSAGSAVWPIDWKSDASWQMFHLVELNSSKQLQLGCSRTDSVVVWLAGKPIGSWPSTTLSGNEVRCL